MTKMQQSTARSHHQREDTEPSGHSGLNRALTTRQVSMIGLSGALGTGLFLGSGSVIALAGPATIISFFLAGLVALAVVWALAEMVATHPVAGGHGTIAAAYLGNRGGFVTRWNFAVELLVAAGAEVTATATYLRFWFPGLPMWVGTCGAALVIIVLNAFSVHVYGSAEYWFSMIKVLAAVGFIVLGLALIVGAVPNVEAVGWKNLTNAPGGFFPAGIVGVLAASCMAVFSFGGIEIVSSTAAESQDPVRAIPRAASAMIWRILLFYVAAITVVLALEPWRATAAAGSSITQSPFVRALKLSGVSAAADVMNVVLIVAALSAANSCMYAASRMIHALAIDKQAPHFASRVNSSGTPTGAVIVSLACLAVAAILSIVAPSSVFMMMLGAATVGILINWSIIMVTHLVFRRRRVDKPSHVTRMWGAPVVNYLVIAACVAVFVALIWLMPVAVYAGVPYLAFLFIAYEVLKRTHALPPAPTVEELEQQGDIAHH
ncbi:MAG: amino acid permease [Actinomycetaceae bacterium]|nr:amino acid permease [Actinomycetaceae bacterium]MDY6083425.1 amino acid permease [Actinomycetaceae bacterium]